MVFSLIPDAVVRLALNQRSVKIQVDYILPALNIVLVGAAIHEFLYGNIVEKDMFLVLFSAFASFLMMIAWQYSKDLYEQIRRADFTAPDLFLYFAVWAILIWQLSTVLNKPWFLESPVKRELLGALFSSVNNMFLLWASMELHFIQQPRWKTWPVFRWLQYGRVVLILTIVVIAVTLLIYYGTGYHLMPANDNGWKSGLILFFIPDFLYSVTLSYILGVGFINIFNSRFIKKIPDTDPIRVIKKFILEFLIILVFAVTVCAQFLHMAPEWAENVISYINWSENRTDPEFKRQFFSVVGLSYRTFLTMLFFMLEISWVRMKKDEETAKINADLAHEAEVNRLLSNEISHRLKNHLSTLAAGVVRQMKKPGLESNPTVINELNATLGRIYATLAVHECLDSKRGEDINNINLFEYLDDLGNRLKNLFSFPEGNFIILLESATLQKNIPYAEGRSIGIVLTELLINVDQHAYPDESITPKWVEIQSFIKENVFYLSVSDRGRGVDKLPDGSLRSLSDGRGLKIVDDIVVRLLKGTIKWGPNNGGARFLISIPVIGISVKEK